MAVEGCWNTTETYPGGATALGMVMPLDSNRNLTDNIVVE